MSFKTEQEDFWAGDFGNEYIERNKSQNYLASNISFFAKALSVTGRVNSVIEFGANIGMNLRALKVLFPDQIQQGIEINQRAAEILSEFVGAERVFNGSIFDFNVTEQFDLSMSKGVLIHINPELLPTAYDKLYQSSKRHILIAEYYNPKPVEIDYRGHGERLYKRDFCGEIMEKYPDLTLVDYGFVYKKDPAFPQDDINWFLLRKDTVHH